MRPSDNQVLQSTDVDDLGQMTTPETATLLKTLSTQLPLDVMQAQQMQQQHEADAAFDSIAEFERMQGMKNYDSDD